MESNIFVHVARYSLVIPMIKDRTEHEITDTSVVNLVSHLSSLVYVVVAFNFSSSSEPTNFFYCDSS